MLTKIQGSSTSTSSSSSSSSSSYSVTSTTVTTTTTSTTSTTTTTSTSTSSSSSTTFSTSTTTSSSTSTSTPTETAVAFTCSSQSITTITENGVQYSLGCQYAANGYGVIGTAAATNSFNDCFLQCDGTTGCTGFTYIGNTANNGAGPGSCALLSSTATSFNTPSDAQHVAAILLVKRRRLYLKAMY